MSNGEIISHSKIKNIKLCMKVQTNMTITKLPKTIENFQSEISVLFTKIRYFGMHRLIGCVNILNKAIFIVRCKLLNQNSVFSFPEPYSHSSFDNCLVILRNKCQHD